MLTKQITTYLQLLKQYRLAFNVTEASLQGQYDALLSRIKSEDSPLSKEFTKYFPEVSANPAPLTILSSEPKAVTSVKKLLNLYLRFKKLITEFERLEATTSSTSPTLAATSAGLPIAGPFFAELQEINQLGGELLEHAQQLGQALPQAHLLNLFTFAADKLPSSLPSSSTDTWLPLARQATDAITALPNQALSLQQSSQNISQSAFAIPGFLRSLHGMINPGAAALEDTHATHIAQSAQALSDYLTNLSQSNSWFRSVPNLMGITKPLITLTTELVNTSSSLTKDSYDQAVVKLNQIRHEHLPLLISHLEEMEEKACLKPGTLTDPALESMRVYYKQAADHINNIVQLAADAVDTTGQHLNHWAVAIVLRATIGTPDITAARLNPIANLSTLEDDLFVAKRNASQRQRFQQALCQSVSTVDSQEAATRFFSAISRLNDGGYKDLTKIPGPEKTKLENDYKQFQTYLAEIDPVLDALIVNGLRSSTQGGAGWGATFREKYTGMLTSVKSLWEKNPFQMILNAQERIRFNLTQQQSSGEFNAFLVNATMQHSGQAMITPDNSIEHQQAVLLGDSTYQTEQRTKLLISSKKQLEPIGQQARKTLFAQIQRLQLSNKLDDFLKKTLKAQLQTKLSPEIFDALSFDAGLPYTTFSDPSKVVVYKKIINAFYHLSSAFKELEAMGELQSWGETLHFAKSFMPIKYAFDNLKQAVAQAPELVGLVQTGLNLLEPFTSTENVLSQYVNPALAYAHEVTNTHLTDQLQGTAPDSMRAIAEILHRLPRQIENLRKQGDFSADVVNDAALNEQIDAFITALQKVSIHPSYLQTVLQQLQEVQVLFAKSNAEVISLLPQQMDTFRSLLIDNILAPLSDVEFSLGFQQGALTEDAITELNTLYRRLLDVIPFTREQDRLRELTTPLQITDALLTKEERRLDSLLESTPSAEEFAMRRHNLLGYENSDFLEEQRYPRTQELLLQLHFIMPQSEANFVHNKGRIDTLYQQLRPYLLNLLDATDKTFPANFISSAQNLKALSAAVASLEDQESAFGFETQIGTFEKIKLHQRIQQETADNFTTPEARATLTPYVSELQGYINKVGTLHDLSTTLLANLSELQAFEQTDFNAFTTPQSQANFRAWYGKLQPWLFFVDPHCDTLALPASLQSPRDYQKAWKRIHGLLPRLYLETRNNVLALEPKIKEWLELDEKSYALDLSLCEQNYNKRFKQWNAQRKEQATALNTYVSTTFDRLLQEKLTGLSSEYAEPSGEIIQARLKTIIVKGKETTLKDLTLDEVDFAQTISKLLDTLDKVDIEQYISERLDDRMEQPFHTIWSKYLELHHFLSEFKRLRNQENATPTGSVTNPVRAEKLRSLEFHIMRLQALSEDTVVSLGDISNESQAAEKTHKEMAAFDTLIAGYDLLESMKLHVHQQIYKKCHLTAPAEQQTLVSNLTLWFESDQSVAPPAVAVAAAVAADDVAKLEEIHRLQKHINNENVSVPMRINNVKDQLLSTASQQRLLTHSDSMFTKLYKALVSTFVRFGNWVARRQTFQSKLQLPELLDRVKKHASFFEEQPARLTLLRAEESEQLVLEDSEEASTTVSAATPTHSDDTERSGRETLVVTGAPGGAERFFKNDQDDSEDDISIDSSPAPHQCDLHSELGDDDDEGFVLVERRSGEEEEEEEDSDKEIYFDAEDGSEDEEIYFDAEDGSDEEADTEGNKSQIFGR